MALSRALRTRAVPGGRISTMSASLSQVKQSGVAAKEEINKLARKYDKLDRRSKLMMRGMFVLLGIDVLLLI